MHSRPSVASCSGPAQPPNPTLHRTSDRFVDRDMPVVHPNHRSILLALKKQRQIADDKCAQLAARRAEAWNCWLAHITDKPTRYTGRTAAANYLPTAHSISALACSTAQQKLHAEANELFQWALAFRREIVHTLGLAGLWDAEAAHLKDSFEAATHFEYEVPPEPVEYLEMFFPQLGTVWAKLGSTSVRGATTRQIKHRRPLSGKQQHLAATLRRFHLLEDLPSRDVRETIRILKEKYSKDQDVSRLLKRPEALRSALRRLVDKYG